MNPKRNTRSTLGGYTLLASSAVRWTLQYGTSPTIETFDMRPKDADALLAGNRGGGGSGGVATGMSTPNGGARKPIELVIDLDGQSKPLKITNLWPLYRTPGENQYVARVAVADRRWFWHYGLISTRYNVRRTVGYKRIQAHNAQPALDQTINLFTYANWSVKTKGQPVDPLDAMVDVLMRAAETEFGYAGFQGAYPVEIDKRIGAKGIKGLPIEDFELLGQFDAEISRALPTLAPEGQLTVKPDGTIFVTSMATQDEAGAKGNIVPFIQGRGYIELIDNSRIRPEGVDVYFVRAHELRFDYNEVAAAQPAAGSTVAFTPDPLGEQRVMENVIPVTDSPTLTLAAQDGGAVVYQGTWITVDQSMRAWGNVPGLNVALDHNFLQQAGVPDMDLWAALQIAGNVQFNVNWAARINAMQTHYRRTFRINAHWRDRLLGIMPYRVATIDVTRGTRAPAMAYGDYAFTWSQRSLWMNYLDGKNKLQWAVNHTGYPATVGGPLDNNSYPSPARVSVLDSDQGIIHVDYIADANRLYEDILPSQVLSKSMPLADLRQRTNPITWDEVIDANNPPRLSPSYNILVILTGVPACPNGLGQYLKVSISPQEAAPLLPGSTIGPCNGPRKQIFIGPGFEVARFAWVDGSAKLIDQSFGVPDGTLNQASPTALDISPVDVNEQLKALCVNFNGNGDQAASIYRIALAAAARVYASNVDRYEGAASGMISPDVWPRGWANTVIHELDPKGIATTRVMIQDKLPEWDIRSLLPASDRQAIGRLVFKQ